MIHTVKIGPTHWWHQAWTRLTEHNPLGANDSGHWIWHCEVVSCLPETCEVANLRCNFQFCQRLACEYLKSGPMFLRTFRRWCFNVCPHVSTAQVHAVCRRTCSELVCEYGCKVALDEGGLLSKKSPTGPPEYLIAQAIYLRVFW